MGKAPKAYASKHRQAQEFIKCGKNAEYFINKYVWIQHPTKRRLIFNTRKYQDNCLKSFKNERLNVILKARQLGLSTLVAAYCLWLSLFFRDQNILIIATKLETAQNMIKKIKFALKRLPKFIPYQIFSETKQKLEFHNGSQIKAIPRSPSAGRSEAVSLLIVDEAAFIQDFDEMWTGLWPTISCLERDTLVPTNNGLERISDLCSGQVNEGFYPLEQEVYSRNGMTNASRGYVSPKSKTITIKTKSGIRLTTTEHHPIFTQRGISGKMIRSDKLIVDDRVRVQVGAGQFSKTYQTFFYDDNEFTLDEEMGYILGGFIAEGWIQNKKCTVAISNIDENFRDKFLNFSIKNFVPVNNSKKLRCYSKKVVEIFKGFGVKPEWKSYSKRIPKSIFLSPESVIKEFLRGYFDGDGWVKKGEDVGVASVCVELLEDVQQLLLNLGIISKQYKLHYPKKDIGNRIMPSGRTLQSLRQGYYLSIPKSQVKKFQNKVGFHIGRKKESLEEICINLKGANSPLLHKILLTQELAAFITELQNLSKKSQLDFRNCGARFDRINRFLGTGDKASLNSSWLKNFKSCLIGTPCETDIIFSLLDELGTEEDFYWDPIVSIEKNEKEVVTYDLTVPKTSCFLQNSILGSNTGGRAIILSTPKGAGGAFYDIYQKALLGENGFNPIKLMWDINPEYDQEWFDRTTAGWSPKKIAQEYLCDFAASGDTFLRPEDFERMRLRLKEPEERRGRANNVWVWEYPKRDHLYVMGADVAAGRSKDFSAFQIISVATGKVVCEYKGKIPVDKYAELLNEIGGYYNDAEMAVEKNNHGLAVIVKLVDLKYPNLYCTGAGKKRGRKIEYIPGVTELHQIGFDTQAGSRLQIITKLEEMIRNDKLQTSSMRFYDELKQFVWIGNKLQAAKGHNDDLVMAGAIAVWIWDISPEYNKQLQKINSLIFSHMGKITNTLDQSVLNPTPTISETLGTQGFGGGSRGGPKKDVNKKAPSKNPFDKLRKMQRELKHDPHDFSWLMDK